MRNSFSILLLFCILYILDYANGISFQERFESSFKNSCLKYDFVHRYWKNLEHPSSRFVIFVYHEPNSNTKGGFGDRLAGIVMSAMVAMRTNRTFFIESSNQFDTLFRPYRNPMKHDPNFYYHNPENKFTYMNKTSWTNFNPALANHDATEYDLWMCIATNKRSVDSKCGLDYGDVAQPIIRIRSNRCYLCKWLLSDWIPAYKELQALGLSSNDDFFEVAGCILRLVMSPTEKLWRRMAELFDKELRPSMPAITQLAIPAGVLESQPYDLDQGADGDLSALTSAEDPPSSHISDDDDVEPDATSVGAGANSTGQTHLRHHTSPDAANASGTAFDSDSEYRGYLVTAHYRCGDISYQGGAPNQCHVDPATNSVVGKSSYMNQGTPLDAVRCVRRVLRNHTKTLVAIRDLMTRNRESESNVRAYVAANQPFFYIASDNLESSTQISELTKYNYSFVSPNGCHVDYDQSFKCLLQTAEVWLTMSLSDVIVVQTANGGTPFSALSRFAGIYGLNGDVFRDILHCDKVLSRKQISHITNGNWYCQ